MIGQITFLDKANKPHTVSLSDTFQWVSSERDLAAALNTLYPARPADRGPAQGAPGLAMLNRVAKWFGGEVLVFRKDFIPQGTVC